MVLGLEWDTALWIYALRGCSPVTASRAVATAAITIIPAIASTIPSTTIASGFCEAGGDYRWRDAFVRSHQ